MSKLRLKSARWRTAHGVTTPPVGEFVISPTFEHGIADKLKFPQVYLRRIRDAGRTDLFDRNVNAWLEEAPDTKYLVRCWRWHHGGPGVVRALLSGTYKIINNYDLMLVTSTDYARSRAVSTSPDISERRMYVRHAVSQGFLKPIISDAAYSRLLQVDQG